MRNRDNRWFGACGRPSRRPTRCGPRGRPARSTRASLALGGEVRSLALRARRQRADQGGSADPVASSVPEGSRGGRPAQLGRRLRPRERPGAVGEAQGRDRAPECVDNAVSRGARGAEGPASRRGVKGAGLRLELEEERDLRRAERRLQTSPPSARNTGGGRGPGHAGGGREARGRGADAVRRRRAPRRELACLGGPRRPTSSSRGSPRGSRRRYKRWRRNVPRRRRTRRRRRRR